MTPMVIGAGWSRTGTYSLALALTELGLGPCQHMADVAANPQLAARWSRCLTGAGGWDGLYDGFGCAVDWPTSAFATALACAYPRARMILTVRPADEWYRSFARTVLSDAQPAPRGDLLSTVMARTAQHALDGLPWCETGWIAAYEQHQATVVQSIAPERLLVYSVREGWGPLCRFLGLPCPRTPFPRANDRVAFRRQMARSQTAE